MTGAELRAWRKRLGWTQIEAAGTLGVRQKTLSDLETGKQPIRPIYALACAEVERLDSTGGRMRDNLPPALQSAVEQRAILIRAHSAPEVARFDAEIARITAELIGDSG